MQALSRWRRIHPLAMLFLGAVSACWLLRAAPPSWAQNAAVSTGTIRMLKGSGPIKYAPSSAGIHLRLLKGTQRADYVLRPRIARQNLTSPKLRHGRVSTAPALRACERRTVFRATSHLSSGRATANKGYPSGSVLLPPIQETHQAPTSPGRRPKAGNTGKNKSSDSAFRIPHSASKTPSAPHCKPSGANRTEPAAAATSLHSTTETETASSPAAHPAPPRAAPLPAPQRQRGQDWPDRKALYDIALLQVIGTMSASLMVSLAIVVSVFVLRRRMREQLPALLRVDAPPTAVPIASPLAPPEMSPNPETFAEESTAQPFDLGPSYQEERRLKEEAERQQEQAVLRTIFEDNLRLRQQLIELESAAA